MKLAKFLKTPILKNIYERVLLYRRCGYDADDVKRTRANASVNNKTQVAKESGTYESNRKLILMKESP